MRRELSKIFGKEVSLDTICGIVFYRVSGAGSERVTIDGNLPIHSSRA